MKKPVTVGDCSALVTGILLAYCLPVSSPMWMVLIGDAFAIIVVKQLYGGIGKNFMNPALSARAFLMSFPVIMTTWPAIRTKLPLFATPDVVSSATPLASLKQGLMPNASLTDLALGMVGGSMGEISALAFWPAGCISSPGRSSPSTPLWLIWAPWPFCASSSPTATEEWSSCWPSCAAAA